MTEIAAEIKGVSFSYKDGENILDNIDLEISKGECILLCGASGCGKTTVTRLLNGLIPHYFEGNVNGTVNVFGMNISETSIEDISDHVGSVFQNPRSQFFCVDTESEIAFGCENQGLDEDVIRKRVSDTVREMKIEKLMGRNIFKLSGGEKQKIACAGVSAMQPQLIVLDEPTSNLDIEAIGELSEILKGWKSAGKTIVIAEHRLGWLKEICDRVIFMENGKISSEYTGTEFFSFDTEKLNSMGLRAFGGYKDYLDSPCGLHKIKDHPNNKFMTLKNFGFSYDRKNVLDIKKLEIPVGGVTAIVGHNGAGKSTFVKCFCGLQKKFKGTIEIDGKIFKSKDMNKISYMVMQDVNHQLFAESVIDEVMLGIENEDENAADDILKKLDLYDYRERHPMSLSGGQKQRTAIASAVLAGKKILIFDEPTSGLDFRRMIGTAELIKNLGDEYTVLIITHDTELIERCCTHVLHIENGKVDN